MKHSSVLQKIDLALLSGPWLLGLTSDIDLNRLDLDDLFLGGTLISTAADSQARLLLANANERRGTPEQEHARRRRPRDPQHEEAHNTRHDEGLIQIGRAHV